MHVGGLRKWQTLFLYTGILQKRYSTAIRIGQLLKNADAKRPKLYR